MVVQRLKRVSKDKKATWATTLVSKQMREREASREDPKADDAHCFKRHGGVSTDLTATGENYLKLLDARYVIC